MIQSYNVSSRAYSATENWEQKKRWINIQQRSLLKVAKRV